MKKLIRVSTVPISLNILLKGQLHYLNQHFDLTAVSGAGPDLEEVAAREKVRVHAIEMQRQIAPLQDVKSLWQLYRYFKKEKPDIVHSITPKAGLLSMLAAKMAGVPVRMHTFTGLIFPSRTGKMQQLLIAMDRLLCASATHIYPEGQGVRQDLIKYKITGKPLKVLAHGNVNGIDPDWFSPDVVTEAQKAEVRQRFSIPENSFVFVFVGRLVREKGINELVAAFKRLQEASAVHPSQRQPLLLLVGPYEQELDPVLPETLAEIQKNPGIITAGFQKDVRPFLAVSDVLAFPSYREGFPNVVLQAGAMGLPAVVTDISGSNEIVEEGKNGLIVPAKNEAALQTPMRRLIEDPELYASTKQNARTMVTTRYEQSVVWNALLEEYRRLAP